MASVIVVLVGLPGAGKTTFSKFCKDNLNNYPVTIFHYDDLCKIFSADERKLVLNQVEEFVLTTQETNVIVIDDNNYYTSMQAEYLKLCKRLKLGFIVVYFKISVLNAQKQNSLRNVSEQVPINIIEEMFTKLEEPNGEHVICVDVDYRIENNQQYELDLQLLSNKIEDASNNPLILQEPHIIVPLPQSLLQKVDIALRKIVNTKIRKLRDKSQAQGIVVLKKEIYTKICNKEIDLFACSSIAVDDVNIDVLEQVLGQYFDV